jgi:alcohol dehydrogenase (cytochrome c)
MLSGSSSLTRLVSLLFPSLLTLVGTFAPFPHKAQAETPALAARHAPELITDEVLRQADEYPADWLMYAKNYSGHRFSPLNQIDRKSVGRLVPKWCFSLGTHGGQQCTPLVHRGIMYVTSTKGHINVIKADTGELLWEFDSKLPDDAIKYAEVDANRGAAIYKDKVIWHNIIGTIFCHDAKTGKVIWQVTPDYYRLGFSKTLAPLIVNGMVIVGVGGGEFGIRGFIEARDADTGKRLWKTYTIPAPGEPGHETWPQDSDIWEHGGAPTWVTGSYDPALNLIYWTTGNAGPWSSEQRPGDNLYCCSVLALDADTGKIRWHFQFVPNDDWDYDTNVTPILTEIEHDGKATPVAVMAVKTGFLYVLDRRDGRFLKAVKFSETPEPPFWAKGLDPTTGRPIESPYARPQKGAKDTIFVAPSVIGAANWWSTAFHLGRRWVIIVANETGIGRVWEPIEYKPGEFFVGMELTDLAKVTRRTVDRPGRVCAYDLRTMKKQWEAEPELEVRWGGPLVTGGELVFSGTLRGFLQALDAETGKTLYQFQTGSGIMAHPITYAVDGRQYVAIVSGKGGVLENQFTEFFTHTKNLHSSGMVFAFGLP